MNANELADELERLYQQDIIDGVADLSMPEAATMLRQLQVENEALKGEVAQLKHMNKNWQISENILLLELEKLQQRELTDEEIGQIWKDCMESPYMQVSNPVGFAKAILRKAQEK